jgi:hypothetical protein
MSRTNRPSDPTPTGGLRRRDVVTATIALGVGVLVAAGVWVGSSPGSERAATVESEAFVIGMVEQGGLVVEGTVIDLGTVPLDITVTPTWMITNTGSERVVLGEAHASVIEGCCPGPLTYSDPVLEPGEATTLAFPLQMHAGMDGPHDFDVHVPYGDGADDYLTLKVVGNFAG